MAKWLLILLAIMVGCAVLGVLVHAVRAIAGIAFLVCLAVLAWQILSKKKARPPIWSRRRSPVAPGSRLRLRREANLRTL